MPPPAECPFCRYELGAINSTTCPECGHDTTAGLPIPEDSLLAISLSRQHFAAVFAAMAAAFVIRISEHEMRPLILGVLDQMLSWNGGGGHLFLYPATWIMIVVQMKAATPRTSIRASSGAVGCLFVVWITWTFEHHGNGFDALTLASSIPFYLLVAWWIVTLIRTNVLAKEQGL